ncbi:hypothetical protein DdX_06382 [Ditylenchus destructor]|uniref:Uncharacterized protein n=1 Tax=Ditylenchus destructor TaxID=166010 RepID=A0AAD4NAT6_9BILA|nr:hypothetical protein DdX_06382 [Ditylenchus destructor]
MRLYQFTTNRHQLRSQSKRPTHWAESQAYSGRALLTKTILTDYLYHSGRSDEAVPVHHEPAPAEKPVEKTDTLGRITSLFRKSTAHEDYPHGLLYEGLQLDPHEPLDHHVSVYHSGRSDEAVPVHHEPAPAEKPIEKTDTLGRITSLFRKSTAHEDYPHGLLYEGPTTSTHMVNDIDRHPLDHHVSVYHSGRSDEAVPVHHEPAPAEKPVEKTDTLGRITSLFRKSTAHEDYPHGLLYEGPVSETGRSHEISGSPLDTHVSVYHSGRSDEAVPVHHEPAPAEKPVEKTDTLGRITSLFRKSTAHEDYPHGLLKSTAHEDYPHGLLYEGPVSETGRSHEISGSPLDTHVSVYHSGRSDEAVPVHHEPAPAEKPVEKTDTLGRITSLFRKSTAHEDYPHGLLYEGPVSETGRAHEISGSPLDTHVSVYHSGRSDEAVPVHQEPAPVEKTDTLGRITSLFRKSTAHEDYPHGLQHEGPVSETGRAHEISGSPLDTHVSVYHSGRSDEAVPVHHEPAPAEKPVEKTDTLGRITSLFRKSTAHEDYPHGLLYEGPTTSTHMVNDIDRHPLDHHVSVYHSGRSDEAVPVHREPALAEKPVEKTDTLGRITSLFRKSTAHEDYPHGLQHEGPVSETGRAHEISGSPLDTHVSVYHSGRSDEAVPVHHEPAPAEKPVEKTDTLGRITSLFRKSTAHEDYPHGLQHEGPVSETGRSHEISGSPLDTHVSVYHSGRSDEAVPVHHEPAPAEKPVEKTDTLGRITSLFRKSTAHEDYPHGLLYEGPVSETGRAHEISGSPLDTHVSVYHSGRSDEAVPVHREPAPAEKPIEKTDTLVRITSLFRKSTAHEDYLLGLQHEGPVSETGRANEISGSPLDTQVSVYHSGRSDEAVPVHHEPAPAEKTVEKTDTLGRITSLFRKSSAHEDYPLGLQHEGPTTSTRKSTAHEDYPHGLLYEGPTTSTHMVNDIDRHPLDHHVSVYHSGRSDEAVPVHREPAPAEKPVEKTDTLGRITSLFRKSTAHEDYPLGLQHEGPHEGPVSETGRANEISGSPLDTHVSVYHSGRSDEAVPVHHEPAPAEKPVEKTDTLGRITSLFRKSTAHEDYPLGLQHEGPVSETGRAHEISGSPLDTHVSVYHSGRSDEAVPVHHEPAPAEKTVEKTDTLGRITSLFRKSTAHEDYPHGLLYEGPTTSTHMVNDIDRHPLDHHVSVYHSGRSDEAVPVHHEPAPAEKTVEKTDTLGRITSLFRKSTAHEDYPHGLQHEGPTTGPTAVPVHHEPAPAEKTVEKTDTLGRITSLFRKSTAHEDYPHGLLYEGPTTSTHMVNDIDRHPLDHHVSVYHSGRSDEAVPVHHEPAPAEKPVEKTDTLGRITSLFRKSTAHEDYPLGLQHEGPVSETGRANEISGSPLDTHVSVYHSGRSDEAVPVHREPAPAEKTVEKSDTLGRITSLFRKSTAHEDYPHGLLYEGPTTSTHMVNDIDRHPLDHHVSVYHSGRSDEAVPVHREPAPAEKPIEKTDTLGRITSLFRKSTAHEDYPLGLQHEGPVSETGRANEISGSPLDTHVSVYHSGRSDEAVPVHREPAPAEKPVEKTDTLGRITSLFRKSTAHEDYPLGLQHEGPVSETGRAHEISGSPLDTHVSVYHSGRSYEAVPVYHEPSPEKPVEDMGPLLSSHPKVYEEPFQENTANVRQINGFYDKPPSGLSHVRAVSFDRSAGREIELVNRHSSRGERDVRAKELGSFSTHEHAFGRTVPRMRTSHSYSDQLVSRRGVSSPGGWTTVTETTTITYAKKTSASRIIEGRTQHVTEDIIVYDHGRGTLPPLSPTFRRIANGGRNYSPHRPAYYNVDQRYNYYRSRSQDPLRSVRAEDKGFQTDFDSINNLDSVCLPTAQAEEDTRRHSRSLSRTARSATTDIQTYRSYSSHLYNRHDYIDDYNVRYRWPSQERSDITSNVQESGVDSQISKRTSYRMPSLSPPMRRSELYAKKNDRDRREGRQFGTQTRSVDYRSDADGVCTAYRSMSPTKTNGHSQRSTFSATIDRSSPTKFPVHTTTVYKRPYQQHSSVSPTAARKLHYQRSNLEELPIDQLFSQLGDDDPSPYEYRNGGKAPVIQPLESRLIDPGYYAGPGTSTSLPQRSEADVKVPMRKARQRVRNYCAML